MEIKLRVCAPLMASLDITYRCNLRCSMCNVWKIARREKELDLEGWKDVINQLIQAFSIRFFRLVGGEPFLRSDFTDIVHYLKARGCSLTIVSNGTLISKKMADFLVSEHVDRIRISINGLQKIDDFYRGKGAFTKTMKGIRALVQEKKRQSVHAPRIEIHPFVSKVNCEEIYKLLRLSRQLKADFRFHWMRGTLEGAIAGKVSRLQDPGFPEDSQKLSIMSLEEKKDFEKRFSISLSFREQFLYHSRKIKDLPILRDCARTAYHFLINPWGYVFPCEFLYNYHYGNCRDKHVREIWEAQERGILRNHIKKGNLQICQICGNRRFLPPTSLLNIFPTSKLNIILPLLKLAFEGK